MKKLLSAYLAGVLFFASVTQLCANDTPAPTPAQPAKKWYSISNVTENYKSLKKSYPKTFWTLAALVVGGIAYKLIKKATEEKKQEKYPPFLNANRPTK